MMKSESRLDMELVGFRALKELKEGDIVFPGFGIPMEVIPQHIPSELGVTLVSENGVIGYGPIIMEEAGWEPEAVIAGGYPVIIPPGASFISEHDVFIALTGKHRIDIAFLGAFQVSEKGDIANWMATKRGVACLGGAMNIALGAKRLVVLMHHNEKDGKLRIVKECSEPITAKGVVSLIMTDLAVIRVTKNGLILEEIAPGVSVEQVQDCTEPNLIVSDDLRVMEF
ncbi:CoA-transferase [Chloroflexota bacterium]